MTLNLFLLLCVEENSGRNFALWGQGYKKPNIRSTFLSRSLLWVGKVPIKRGVPWQCRQKVLKSVGWGLSRLKDISTLDFSTPSFNLGPFNPRLFNHELFNSGFFKSWCITFWSICRPAKYVHVHVKLVQKAECHYPRIFWPSYGPALILPMDYGRQIKPFFNDIPNFWVWVDKLGW